MEVAVLRTPTFIDGFVTDVAGDRPPCVEPGPDGAVRRAQVVPSGDVDRIVPWAAEMGVVAIDAPAAPSTEPHRSDGSLPPKFHAARCCEIAIDAGRSLRYRIVGSGGGRSGLPTGLTDSRGRLE